MRFERFLYLLTQQVFVETRSTIKNWWKQVAAKDLTTDGNLKPNLSEISKSQTGSLCSTNPRVLGVGTTHGRVNKFYLR